jgi:hypothetical protein
MIYHTFDNRAGSAAPTDIVKVHRKNTGLDKARTVLSKSIKANPWVSTGAKGDDAGSERVASGNDCLGEQCSALPSGIAYRTDHAYGRGTILEADVGDTTPRTHRGDSRRLLDRPSVTVPGRRLAINAYEGSRA